MPLTTFIGVDANGNGQVLGNAFLMNESAETLTKALEIFHSVLKTTFASALMTRDRFMALLSNLHLNDNTNYVPRGQDGQDALFKIRNVVNWLQQVFRENYILVMSFAWMKEPVDGRAPTGLKN